MNPKLKPLPLKQSMGSQLASINKPLTTVTSTNLCTILYKINIYV